MTEQFSGVHRRTSALVLARVTGPLVSVVLLAFLGRRAGVEEVGLYGLAVAVYALLEAAGSLGLRHLLARELARDSDRTTLGTAAFLCSSTGLVLALSLTASTLLLDSTSTRTVLLMIAPALPLSGLLVAEEGFWIGTERLSTFVMALLVEHGFRLIAGTVILVFHPSAAGLLAIFVAGKAIAALCARPPGGLRLGHANYPRIVSLLRQIPSFLGLEILFQLYWRVDVVLLSLLAHRVEVGYYVAAYRIFSGLLLLPQSYGQVLLPSLVRHPSRSNVTRALAETAVMGTAGAVAVLAFAPMGIRLLFGASFSPSASVLGVLALGLLPACVDQPLGRALVARKRQNRDLAAVAVATGLNIVLNLLLIPSHGAEGAAIATVISLAISVVGHGIALRTLSDE